MHLVDEKDAVPIRSHDELISYFASAGKPPSQWRVGTEHELVGVHSSPPSAAGTPPTYEGPQGIGALFDWFASRGGTPVIENGHTIALQRENGEQLTIEPGGQFELAARPVEDDCGFLIDLKRYLGELGEASKALDLVWLSAGLRPFAKREDVPIMPKQRYDVMRAYMPTVGTRGLDMMLRTATVQVNLDYADEADAASKMRCIYSITSILTALWANSPIAEDRPTGMQSVRAWIWRDTDNQRAGLLPFVFERDDIFQTYTEWALDVPLYFIYRGGYKPVPGGFTFRQYMRDGFEGEHATMADWAMHLSTLFPEGRLKKFIEVRGCDCGSIDMISALSPMMRGVLYDPTARAAATQLTAGMSFADRQRLADDVPLQGLSARAGNHTLGELARELVAIAQDGLSRVAPASMKLLAPVEEIAKSGVTQADQMVAIWQRAGGDRATVLRALAHPGLGPA